MINIFHPEPAPPAFGKGKVLPERQANPFSRLIFGWISSFLNVGYSRPLEKDDLWELPDDSTTFSITNELENYFYRRCPPEKRPLALRARLNQDHEEETVDQEQQSGDSATDPKTNGKSKNKVYDSSLAKALFQTFFYECCISGMLKLISDTLKTTTPLLTKVILIWLEESYYYYRIPAEERQLAPIKKPKGLGYGIGLAFAMFAMQEVASLMTNHYMQITLTLGLYVRTGIIGVIFRKSLRLSGRARLDHPAGQITTMIAADTARLDRLAGFFHNVWVAPIQIMIGVALLIDTLGYSALVGLGVLIIGFPIQFALARMMFTQRKKGVKITDSRLQLTTEVLQGIRLIKFYAWEQFYVSQVSRLRTREVHTLRAIAMARSILIAVVTFLPVLASILSFITYALTKHQINAAVIFSSLQLLNVIRMPLLYLPLVISVISDALVALRRTGKFLTAEELAEPYTMDYEGKNAVEVDGDFTWETAGKASGSKFTPEKGGEPAQKKSGVEVSENASKAKRRSFFKRKNGDDGAILPTTSAEANLQGSSGEKDAVQAEEEKPFELKNLNLQIPKGQFVAIVGRVGCGKSSVLQALIGEMRRTRGSVVFGGSVAYVPQTAWIKNATLRENVTFGRPDDEDKFREVVGACSLEHDLQMLPNGELTEVGERGINLSGGQKARVSLARAAYSESDIILLDDSLSAVDAYVGKAILENCILNGPLVGRTRILVTHSLHVLDKTDYIYVMENGVITEQGTYDDLIKGSVVFARLIEEYGNLQQEEQQGLGNGKRKDTVLEGLDALDQKPNAALMQTEERFTGAVSWRTYANYLRFAGTVTWAPIIIGLLILSQGAQVGSTLFLGFWTAESIPKFTQTDYMATYAGLGVATAFFGFLVSFSMAYATLRGSLSMFKAAFAAVLRSPASFFDTTPMGRILSRLSKDQDTLDTELAMTLWQFLSTLSSVLGTVALVFYTFPLLGTIFVPMVILYQGVSTFYRRSSVETKRLDSLMRSALYASYSESLTGLSTIRAYRDQDRCIASAERGLDWENQAYYMTISLQQWLAVRLDLFGNLLVLGIVLFGAGFRQTINPAKVGVVLTYALSITQVFSQMVAQFATNEQNMNAVERVLVYAELPPEEDGADPEVPPASWPETGEIQFNNVDFAYREGLPLVLKDVSFKVGAGEKVGIVGRTGAGKSSLLQALFRMVELQGGQIDIDGRNIRHIGLSALRSSLALVPQDTTLFLGTLRDNLDPQATRTDAELISALQRAWLLPRDGSVDPAAEAKFSLDSKVGDEGSNFSAGEKQLLALCRALVKNSRIIVLDEATSSVDVETDAKLQRTIQSEFASSTLLCIAHRLNTITNYDRILVMDQGRVAEFDTVLNLFDKEDSIFRSLCDEASLSRQDILRIRASGAFHKKD